MSKALENVDSHAQLVQRARKHIKQFECKLLGHSDDSDERREQNDSIAGAFEIAARQLTSEDGSFLNTDYRSGHIDSFRGGTADLDRRMTNRFTNRVNSHCFTLCPTATGFGKAAAVTVWNPFIVTCGKNSPAGLIILINRSNAGQQHS